MERLWEQVVDVASLPGEHIDDLAALVHSQVHVRPNPSHSHVGLIYEPAVTNTVPARPRDLDDQWREALHPPVDGGVIDVHAAFRQEFSHVSLRPPVAEIPARRHQDHVGREPVAGQRNRTRLFPGTPVESRRSGVLWWGEAVAVDVHAQGVDAERVGDHVQQLAAVSEAVCSS
jgi:hypothetical protein